MLWNISEDSNVLTCWISNIFFGFPCTHTHHPCWGWVQAVDSEWTHAHCMCWDALIAGLWLNGNLKHEEQHTGVYISSHVHDNENMFPLCQRWTIQSEIVFFFTCRQVEWLITLEQFRLNVMRCTTQEVTVNLPPSHQTADVWGASTQTCASCSQRAVCQQMIHFNLIIIFH